MYTDLDVHFMQEALRLAAQGLYTTTPNPRVGCVLVRGGEVVGRGFHEMAGQPHAEVVALLQAGERARGATAFITLEPCNHWGRTGPCTEALISAGVTAVVAAMQDPNPQVAGSGLERLRAAGLSVRCGLLQDQAEDLNLGFTHRMRTGRPWVRAKLAMSLDGRLALPNGVSQWITDAAARADGHHWRARACAVMTGIGTVLSDNPRLTVREVRTPRQPRRIVLDSRLRLPADAALIEEGGLPVVVTAVDPGSPHFQDWSLRLADRGGQLFSLPADPVTGQCSLRAVLDLLADEFSLNELHLEAGAVLTGAMAREGLINEYLLYQAPIWIGEGLAAHDFLGPFSRIDEIPRGELRGLVAMGEGLRMRVIFPSQPAGSPVGSDRARTGWSGRSR